MGCSNEMQPVAWGWKMSKLGLTLIQTDLLPASEDILQVIRCGCTRDYRKNGPKARIWQNRGNFSTHFNWKHLKFQLPISKDMDFMAQGWLWYPLGLPLGKLRALKLWKFTSIQLLNWSTSYIPNFRLPSLKIWLSRPRGSFSTPRDCPWMPPEPQMYRISQA